MIHTFIVNGKSVNADCDPGDALADVLRGAGYMEVKKACGTGNCGLCTVLLDSVPVPSCSVFAGQANGKSITTIRGAAAEAAELAAYLVAEGVDQCGYCSPGFALMVIAMRKELRNPQEAEIKSYLSGNLCRCSGYQGHLRAIVKYMRDSACAEANRG